MKLALRITFVSTLALAILPSARAQGSRASSTPKYDAKHPPRFEDFPATEKWNQVRVALKLSTGSERMFRTNLTNASKMGPNFAGHYVITYWGCGSGCSAGAMIDLHTGNVFPLPLTKPNGTGWMKWIQCTASVEGTGTDFQLDSRLMIVRCGMNFEENLNKNVPDLYYFVWEDAHFRQLLLISEKHSEVKDTACVDACPVDVINPRKDEPDYSIADQFYFFPDDCIE